MSRFAAWESEHKKSPQSASVALSTVAATCICDSELESCASESSDKGEELELLLELLLLEEEEEGDSSVRCFFFGGSSETMSISSSSSEVSIGEAAAAGGRSGCLLSCARVLTSNSSGMANSEAIGLGC